MNEARCRRLIDRAVGTFSLDLSGYSVLTEAATGYYMLTPLIAALARADRVLALSRDSRWGTAREASTATARLADRWGVGGTVEVLDSRSDARIGEADIVTNLGFVRPLDAFFLRKLKSSAVIPLMWETWEYRPDELDLRECSRLGIPVLGTNEHHPDLRTFEFVGHIGLKALRTLDIEVFRSRIVVLGSGEFAEWTDASLAAGGADVFRATPDGDDLLSTPSVREALSQADAIVVVEHHTDRALIGTNALIDPVKLSRLNPGLVVIHICGTVDETSLASAGLQCYPQVLASPKHMSLGTDYLGPRPLIDLHTAGLKVGEEMGSMRRRGLSGREAELETLRTTSLAQGSRWHSVPEGVGLPGGSSAYTAIEARES